MTPSKPSFDLPPNPPDSVCACGHLESLHAPLSPFGLTVPHGGVCNGDPSCPCRRFVWKRFVADRPPPPTIRP